MVLFMLVVPEWIPYLSPVIVELSHARKQRRNFGSDKNENRPYVRL